MLCERFHVASDGTESPILHKLDPNAAGRLFEYRPALVMGSCSGCCDQFTTLLTGSRDSYVGSEPEEIFNKIHRGLLEGPVTRTQVAQIPHLTR